MEILSATTVNVAYSELRARTGGDGTQQSNTVSTSTDRGERGEAQQIYEPGHRSVQGPAACGYELPDTVLFRVGKCSAAPWSVACQNGYVFPN